MAGGKIEELRFLCGSNGLSGLKLWNISIDTVGGECFSSDQHR